MKTHKKNIHNTKKHSNTKRNYNFTGGASIEVTDIGHKHFINLSNLISQHINSVLKLTNTLLTSDNKYILRITTDDVENNVKILTPLFKDIFDILLKIYMFFMETGLFMIDYNLNRNNPIMNTIKNILNIMPTFDNITDKICLTKMSEIVYTNSFFNDLNDEFAKNGTATIRTFANSITKLNQDIIISGKSNSDVNIDDIIINSDFFSYKKYLINSLNIDVLVHYITNIINFNIDIDSIYSYRINYTKPKSVYNNDIINWHISIIMYNISLLNDIITNAAKVSLHNNEEWKTQHAIGIAGSVTNNVQHILYNGQFWANNDMLNSIDYINKLLTITLLINDYHKLKNETTIKYK
jgi:hypothetical protein